MGEGGQRRTGPNRSTAQRLAAWQNRSVFTDKGLNSMARKNSGSPRKRRVRCRLVMVARKQADDQQRQARNIDRHRTLKMRPTVVTKWILASSVFLVIGGIVWYSLISLKTPYAFSVETSFAVTPADDEALISWLRAQPGVIAKWVWVERRGKVLRVNFSQERDSWGEPPIPDLDSKCKELGYLGAAGRFRDSPGD
jgi:hypothetical protein